MFDVMDDVLVVVFVVCLFDVVLLVNNVGGVFGLVDVVLFVIEDW